MQIKDLDGWWANYLPEAERVLLEYLTKRPRLMFSQAPSAVDRAARADIVCTCASPHVLLRCRAEVFYRNARYRHDVTFRSRTPGGEPEFNKVISDRPSPDDLFLYGFTPDVAPPYRFIAHQIVDMHLLRAVVRKHGVDAVFEPEIINHDFRGVPDGTAFRVLNTTRWPQVVVDSAGMKARQIALFG